MELVKHFQQLAMMKKSKLREQSPLIVIYFIFIGSIHKRKIYPTFHKSF